AFCYFVKEIFPLISRKVPEVKFIAVGSGLARDMLSYAGARVAVTGDVEDVRKYLDQATVFVAPVRLGGGIKGKVLEAMASGIPVVATLEASRGIRCKDGENILVAGDAADFAGKTAALLGNAEQRGRLAAAARSLVEEEYDWVKITLKLDAFYGSLCRERHASPP
ncbi:MAG: glycosyltransferase family 4 protein, partial [Endomicrobiales bacterium]